MIGGGSPLSIFPNGSTNVNALWASSCGNGGRKRGGVTRTWNHLAKPFLVSHIGLALSRKDCLQPGPFRFIQDSSDKMRLRRLWWQAISTKELRQFNQQAPKAGALHSGFWTKAPG